MTNKYDIRKGADDLWEVFEVVTGQIVTMGGMVLSGLDQDGAKGALDALHNQIVEPNGSQTGSSDSSEESP
jgi:hypothetical protein